MTRYSTKFYGIFIDNRLIFSNLNGMAFLFDTEREAILQLRSLRATLGPIGKCEVKPALLVEEE